MLGQKYGLPSRKCGKSGQMCDKQSVRSHDEITGQGNVFVYKANLSRIPIIHVHMC